MLGISKIVCPYMTLYACRANNSTRKFMQLYLLTEFENGSNGGSSQDDTYILTLYCYTILNNFDNNALICIISRRKWADRHVYRLFHPIDNRLVYSESNIMLSILERQDRFKEVAIHNVSGFYVNTRMFLVIQ